MVKETSDEVKELINTIPPKEITERCRQIVEKASNSGIKLQGNYLAQRCDDYILYIRVRDAQDI